MVACENFLQQKIPNSGNSSLSGFGLARRHQEKGEDRQLPSAPRATMTTLPFLDASSLCDHNSNFVFLGNKELLRNDSENGITYGTSNDDSNGIKVIEFNSFKPRHDARVCFRIIPVVREKGCEGPYHGRFYYGGRRKILPGLMSLSSLVKR